MFDELAQIINGPNLPTENEIIFYNLISTGLSARDIEECPIPFLIGIFSTAKYQKEKEEEKVKNNNGFKY